MTTMFSKTKKHATTQRKNEYFTFIISQYVRQLVGKKDEIFKICENRVAQIIKLCVSIHL